MALLLPPSATGSSHLAGASSLNPLSELLRSPEDLLKLSAHRKKLLKEKAQIDARLNECVKAQLDETRDGLRRLQEAKNQVARLREEMIEIEQLKNGNGEEGDFEIYGKISKVASIHRNLSQTALIVNNLRTMSEKVAYLDSLLTSDQAHPLGPCGPATNLLPIHYHMQQLESFRNETLHLAKKTAAKGEQGQEDRRTLVKWFERLDDLGKRFEEWLWAIALNILDTVKEGNPGTVVRLLKIIEVEGKEDEKAVGLRLARKVVNADSAMRTRSMQANARVIKNYRHKLLDIITKSIHRSFDDAEIRATDGVQFLEDLQWIFRDLDRIEAEVRPLFPEDYKVWEYYVKGYHKRLDEGLQGIVKSNPEARVLLRMHAWIKEYRSVMKEFDVPQAWLQPPLLDGKSQNLIDDYVSLIVDKIDKWTVNLMRTETKDFSSRDAPPETDPEGMYGLQFAMIMFQMTNQQVDLAADSGQGAVLARVVAESSRVMMSTQSQWVKVLEREYNRQVNFPETVPPGLVEYVIALANDQLKSADYAEAMSARLEPLVSEKYAKVISEKTTEAIDGYLDVAKKCIGVLINLVFNDLRSVSKNLFTPQWYIEPLMDQIVETMKDYMSDYKDHLNPAIFDILVEDILIQFLSIYLNALRRVPPKTLRIPSSIDKMKTDIAKVFTFLSEYKNQDDLEKEFEIIDMIISMLAASPQMIFMDYWQFAKKHGPNMQFVEAVLRGRDDLDKVTLGETVEMLRRKTREEGITEPDEPTIMVKVENPNESVLTNLASKAAAYAAPLANAYNLR